MSGPVSGSPSHVFGIFRQTGGVWAGVAGLSVIINLLMLTGPIFMLQVYDRVLASGSVPTLVVLGGLAFALFCFYGILDLIRGRILLRLGQYVDARISEKVFQFSNVVPLIAGQNADNLRPVQDLDTVRNFLSGPGPSALCDSPWMPFYLLIVYLFHPLLGFVGLVGACIIVVLMVLNELLSRKPMREASREGLARQALAEAGRNNSEVVKAMGMAPALGERWKGRNGTYLAKHKKAADRSSFFSVSTKTIRFILQSSVLGFGAWLAIKQEISPGVMIAASILVSRALSPIEVAVGQWRGFQAARQAYGRLVKGLSMMVDFDKQIDLPLPKSELSVEKMSGAPGGAKKPAIHGIAFQVKAGQGVGIIGPSGSGKSTLAKSLVGVLPVLAGAVRLDGSELEQWSEDTRRKIIGFLPQDIQIFDGTVADNISRFESDGNSDAIIEAARLADLHDMISRLPDGYNTVIGKSGYALSGGQMQRIGLARALFGNPFLIVLDEPNSNLDTQGEDALTKALQAMKAKGSIIVVIAHRPSALAAVELVLCLNEGRQEAFGPRDKVLQQVLKSAQDRKGAAQ